MAGFPRIDHDELFPGGHLVSDEVQRLLEETQPVSSAGNAEFELEPSPPGGDGRSGRSGRACGENATDSHPLYRGDTGPERDHERPVHVRAERVPVAPG